MVQEMTNFNKKTPVGSSFNIKRHVEARQHVAGTENSWEGAIEKMLGEAVQGKEWKNLPGKGRPMNLNSPDGVPADQVMGNKIMKNNNVAPVWIEERKALAVRIENWRRKLSAKVHALGLAALLSERQQAILNRELADLNKNIASANIAIPIFRLELVQLDLAAELQRAQEK